MPGLFAGAVGRRSAFLPCFGTGSRGAYILLREIGMKKAARRWLKLALLQVLLVSATTVYADIGGTIFRDFNLNGVADALEPGVENIVVTAYDDTGTAVATDTTATDGSYNLVIPAAGRYRVEVSGLPSYLKPGTAISGVTQPLVSIIDNGVTHNVGLSNAGEYSQANPDIIMTRFAKGARTGGNADVYTVLRYAYTANDTDAPINIATYAQVGSVYGVAHLRKANASYVSTYFKRHADIGPAGIGAIYKIDHTAGNAVSTFAVLPGTDPRGAGAGYDWNHDTNGYADVGKTGIGDIELSDDESKLFAVNMDDRRLYVIDVDANGDAGAVASHAIPDPCDSPVDFRPMGLGFRDGMLYVGVTCTAESTVDANNADSSTNGPRKGDKTRLSAHVYSFSPDLSVFSVTPVLDIDLGYDRGCIYSSDISNQDPATCTYVDHAGATQPYRGNWNPWQMDYDIVFNDKAPGNIGNQDGWIEYMQPLLSDIEFDNDGAMIIAIRDVNGDRTGHENNSPNPADATTQNGNGEGDILRACGNAQAGWTLESNGACGGVTTGGANNSEGLGGGEYYWYDNGPGGNGNVSGGANGHSDTAMGGLLVVPGHADLVTGVMDVHGFLDNGLMWLRNDNGQISTDGGGTPKRLLVSVSNFNIFFGKASGIGDLEALRGAAPVEIGNYVWNDVDNDGIQDPSEAALPGVTVNLYEGAALVGTAVTGPNGEYYFGGLANTNMAGGNPLKPLTAYQLRIDLADAALGGLVPTQEDVNANADDTHDNDGDNGVLNPGFSTIAYTTGGAGENDHTLDFGFVAAMSIGSIIWDDSNIDGSQDAGEPGIPGATVRLLVDDGTGTFVPATHLGGSPVGNYLTLADGRYYFDNLPEGDYRVEVTMPPGYAPTINQNAADNDDNPNDSNIASSAGNVHTSGIFTLTNNAEPSVDSNIVGSDDADNANENNGNMTVDFGFTPAVSIGSLIWNDQNNNGLQDAGEQPLPGAVVTLLDGSGNPVSGVASQTTGSDGLYYFGNLPAGDYRIQVTPPAGYSPSTVQNGADNDDTANDSNIAGPGGVAGSYVSGTFTLSNNGEPTETGGLPGSDDGDSGDEDNGNMSVDFGFYQPVASLSVVKSSSFDPGADGHATVGDIVTYTYVVENTGTTVLTGVSIHEDAARFTGTGMLPVITWQSNSDGSPEGTLVPGERALYASTYAITQDDIDAGGIDNQVLGTGTPPGGPAVSDLSDSGNTGDPNETGQPGSSLEDDATGTPLSAPPPPPPTAIPTLSGWMLILMSLLLLLSVGGFRAGKRA